MTTSKKKKKSARERRVLVASIICAGLIVAGSTFAWFTSTDEVTNRLSANADYNVTIAEDFQPPEDWVPGQKINKDVSAVNTGNVDAFVRMWVQGEMNLFSELAAEDSTAITDSGLTMTAVNDDRLKNLNLNYSTGSGATTKYFKELSKDRKENPKTPSDIANTPDPETNIPGEFSEIQAVQAGGYLVYAPASAKYSYVLEQATEITAADNSVVSYPKGTVVYTNGATGTNTGTDIDNGVSTATSKVEISPVAATSNVVANAHAIDTDTFVPETKGVYIFRRNTKLADTVGTVDTYEYSGYYYDGDGHYFALRTEKAENTLSDYVLPTGAVTVTGQSPSNDPGTYTIDWAKIKLFTVAETIVKNDELGWTYSAATAAFTVTPHTKDGADTYYTKGSETTKYSDVNCTIPSTVTDDSGYTTGATINVPAKPDRMTATYTNTLGKPLTIDVVLANIGEDAEEWTVIGTGATTTFYYNNDVEAGDTTNKLIDYVQLGENVGNDSYLAFDFDLNVFLESIQVTVDEAGTEGYVSVAPWAANDTKNTAATGADNGTRTVASEVEKISWTV